MKNSARHIRITSPEGSREMPFPTVRAARQFFVDFARVFIDGAHDGAWEICLVSHPHEPHHFNRSRCFARHTLKS